MIIHVSGTTGSGKTYLGNFISQLYDKSKIAVIDLDDILHQILNNPQITKIEDSIKQFEKIETEIQSKFQNISKKYKNVLFVGYCDVQIGPEIKIIPLKADHKYFIDISPQ